MARLFRSQAINRGFRHKLALALALALQISAGSAVRAAEFSLLPNLPDLPFGPTLRGISADGSVVVGSGTLGGDGGILMWTDGKGPTVLEPLDPNNPHLSGGTVVIGDGFDGRRQVGFYSTTDHGTTAIGTLSPFDAGDPYSTTHTEAVSDDGRVIVGWCQYADSDPNDDVFAVDQAFVWTTQGGMVGLGDLAGGAFGSRAVDVSADGSKVVGLANTDRGSEAVYWTSNTGFVKLGRLSDAPDAADDIAQAVSFNGAAIVGAAHGRNGFEAFRWTQETGMMSLGELDSNETDSNALDVSADGKIVVGRSFVEGDETSFIWDSLRGKRLLADVLVHDFGLTTVLDYLHQNRWGPFRVEGMTDDANVLFGQDWVADLRGAYMPGDADFDGSVTLEDFGLLKAHFGTGKFRDQGDFSADGRVDLSDFGILKANFGAARPVPEPTPLLLALFGIPALLRAAASGRARLARAR
ncbi:MAG: hypothetical protein U0836_10040 [Pirellulales bacterium]